MQRLPRDTAPDPIDLSNHSPDVSCSNPAHLGVEHDRDMLAAARGEGTPKASEGGTMGLVVTVAKVETRHIHARIYESAKGLLVPAGRPEGADDLGFPPRLITRGEDAVLAAGWSEQDGGEATTSDTAECTMCTRVQQPCAEPYVVMGTLSSDFLITSQ